VQPTLTVYIARRFLITLGLTVLVVAGVILLFDVIELLRQTAKVEEATLALVVRMGLLRLPLMLQTALPFVFLAAALMTFWRLSRSSELIVVRAAGVSVWQIMLPLFALVLFLGVINVGALNPVAATLFTQFERVGQTVGLGTDKPFSLSRGGLWLRERKEDGFRVIHARKARQDNAVLFLSEVLVLEIGRDDIPDRRIDARAGRLSDQRLILEGVTISMPGEVPQRLPTMDVSTGLSLPEIQEKFAAPESISFWALPDFIAFFESAGFSPQAHRMHWYALLASPAMLCAMVLLAAVFGFNANQRRGGWLARVVGCTVTGFLVYFFSQVTYTLGQSQTLPVVLAAWSPALVAGLLGLALLFHLEDG
jgi:lipopolysaccharide export system permease protein